MLANDEIKKMVEGAFIPLRCVAEIWDYGAKLRFKVFDQKGEGVIVMPEAILKNIRGEKQLRELLSQARERVQQKGFLLKQWQ